ncbi:DUF1127 domain-containing protein [Ovoidimarina sediminis]|nr:DUF1127 domain-containing protein [Rhodophyticola sp. MJ-SS7]
MQALSLLSDKQLAEIGIERSDIPSYADRLMTSVHEGDEDSSEVKQET